MMILLAVI